MIGTQGRWEGYHPLAAAASPPEAENCTICLYPIDISAKEAPVACKGCKKALHSTCFANMAATTSTSFAVDEIWLYEDDDGQPIKALNCPACRNKLGEVSLNQERWDWACEIAIGERWDEPGLRAPRTAASLHLLSSFSASPLSSVSSVGTEEQTAGEAEWVPTSPTWSLSSSTALESAERSTLPAS